MRSYLLTLFRFRHSRQCPLPISEPDITGFFPSFYDIPRRIATQQRQNEISKDEDDRRLSYRSLFTIISLPTPTTEGGGRVAPLVALSATLVRRGNEIRARGHISREHLNCDSNRRSYEHPGRLYRGS